MKLTKEECKQALIELFYDEDGCMRDGLTYEFDVLEQLINDYFEDLSWKEITMINQNLGTKYLEKYNELYKEHLKLKEELEKYKRMLETFK